MFSTDATAKVWLCWHQSKQERKFCCSYTKQTFQWHFYTHFNINIFRSGAIFKKWLLPVVPVRQRAALLDPPKKPSLISVLLFGQLKMLTEHSAVLTIWDVMRDFFSCCRSSRQNWFGMHVPCFYCKQREMKSQLEICVSFCVFFCECIYVHILLL